MKTVDLIDLIEATAKSCQVDPDLALAISSQESGYDTTRVRYEEGWEYLVTPDLFATHLGISVATETELQKFSWGVMQVMGSVTRELGFLGPLTTLIDPTLGVLYGCKKLQALGKHYTEEANIISAYNAGTPGKIGGKYRNQEYVTSVLNILTRLKRI